MSSYTIKISSMGKWFAERFPILNIVSAALLFFVMFGYLITRGVEFTGLSLNEILASLAVVSQLLLLRILDEFKDYDEDVKNHPDRVLQRGLITLQDLKFLAVICISFQVFVNYWFQAPINFYWFSMVLWTGLMTKEFFVSEWLKKHIFVYLFSHMFVMLLMCVWICSLYTSDPLIFWPVYLLIFLGSILFELTRKTRGLDENKNLDSYPKEIGFLNHTVILILVSAFVFLSKNYMLRSANLKSGWFLYVEGLVMALMVLSIVSFHKEKTAKNRKKLEGMYGLMMLIIYLHFIYLVYFK